MVSRLHQEIHDNEIIKTDLISSDGVTVRPGDMIEVHFSDPFMILHRGMYVKHKESYFEMFEQLPSGQECTRRVYFFLLTIVTSGAIKDVSWHYTSPTDTLHVIS